jgi:hypothetical protein
MAAQGNPSLDTLVVSATAPTYSCGVLSELEDELRSANEDFESGDFIELTAEKLERCVTTGESPWQGEFHG